MTKIKAALETDPDKGTIALTMQEIDGEAVTTTTRTAKFTPESAHHARLWITSQFNTALEIINEATA